MDRWRCFVAVPIPPDLRAALQAAVETSRAEPMAPDLRWTDPAGWHLTLAFLGSVAVDVVPAIERAVSDAASRGAPELVAGSGFGVFPAPRRARVLWYGLADERGFLRALAQDVRERLTPIVPQLAEDSTFRAHVTLARARAERGLDLSAWLEARAAPAGTVPVDRLILYRSHLGGRGPARYEALGFAPLGGAEWIKSDVGAEASVHG
jgi:2'-5' RNA ligase